jgi:hypothetical protein
MKKSELRQLIREVLKEEFARKTKSTMLKEARSSADIEAEIARLQQELAQAKVAEKKATYGGNRPTMVYTWDMYIDPADKGTWLGLELYKGELEGTAYETKEEAINGGIELLGELGGEGELDGYADDYTIDVIAVPVSKLSDWTIENSNLEHLV